MTEISTSRKENMTEQVTWRELFPSGRSIFYEGDKPEKFTHEIQAEFGFDPTADELWGGDAILLGPNGEHFGDPFGRIYMFKCPAEHLDAIYGGDRWPMGSNTVSADVLTRLLGAIREAPPTRRRTVRRAVAGVRRG